MKIISGTKYFTINNSIVTLGKFDGNHIGHRLLFNTAKDLKRPGDNVVIFTFNIAPANIIKNETFRTILTHEERRYDEYEDFIDYIIEYPFDKEVMSMAAEDFTREILCRQLNVKHIVVGEDFRFGHNRSGDVELLKSLGSQLGFQVTAVKKVEYKGREVSSTYIKEEILKGNMEAVSDMLGGPFTMQGRVLEGKHLGRTIGFPTINFAVPEDKVLPPCGVYATKTEIGGIIYNSITNVGVRPTFNDGDKGTVETNIFDFNEDIYGQICRIEFHSFIRPERKFDSAEELVIQMKSDKELAKKILS